MKGMEERRDAYLQGMVKRAMEEKPAVGSRQSAIGSSQFETPKAVGSSQSSAGSRQSTDGSSESVGVQSASGPKTSGRKGKGGFFRGLISGTIISESLILKDMKYSALIAVLAIIFISNKFSAERVERQIIVLEQEVRDMRAESLSVSAELGSVSRQSEITDLVKERGLGLEELREPPYRIVVNE